MKVTLLKGSGFLTNRLPFRFIFGALAIFIQACSLDGLVTVDDPQDGESVDIGEVTTRAGVLAVYASAIGKFQIGVNELSSNVSLFTDELSVRSNFAGTTGLDARIEKHTQGLLSPLGVVVASPYEYLNSSRINFLQIRDIVRNLNDSSLNYLVSAAYALEGYTVLLLAENYCSGIPFPTLTFDGSVKYVEGSSTTEALKLAISLFDSSQIIHHDSTRFKVLSQIGKGRAYLSLGLLDSAFISVQDVNPTDVYNLHYSDLQVTNEEGFVSKPYAFWTTGSASTLGSQSNGVRNFEGTNGIQWFPLVGAPDARVPVTQQILDGINVAFQQKYITGNVVLPLAGWIERKMIESEYWMNEGDPRWLDAINEARRTRSIQDTTDPGLLEARVDLLFRERAFWFYLNGYRLGDYRRLVRQYGKSPYEVYPSGIYEGGYGEYQLYGDAFVFYPPEFANVKYQGCNHKDP